MIDPGEALLATVGIRPLLTKETERITAPQLHRAADMEGAIDRLASKLTRGELGGEVEMGEPFEYDRMLRALAEGPDEAQIQGMLDSLPPAAHDTAAAFLMAAQRALDYLRQQFPISLQRDLTTTQNLPPATMLQAKFETVLALLDRPLAVFDLLDTNALLGSQARALKAVFPTIYQAVLQALGARDAYEHSRSASYVPHFAPALATLTGAPRTDQATATALKASAADRAQRKAQQAARASQPPPTGRSTKAEAVAPPSQKAEAGNAPT